MVPNEYFSKFYPDINVEETAPELTDTLKVSAYSEISKQRSESGEAVVIAVNGRWIQFPLNTMIIIS